MAIITNTSQTSVLTINRWLGINENPDGDTKLKLGEASEMRNWRITKDGHLRVRSGYSEIISLSASAVTGIWQGYINGVSRTLAVCGGKLYSLNLASPAAEEIGSITGSYAHFFGFGGKAYLLTGSKYYVYDGTTLAEVEGYRPLVAVSVPPAGGGTLLERVNRLNGKRRAWFSPDGTSTTYQLPEKNLTSVDYVKKTADNSSVTFTVNLSTGAVTISPALSSGTNSIEIGWTVASDSRAQVEKMRFSETYNGETDTRVFLYGDGSNKAIYSGLDYNGQPTAEYFPDLNEIAVDSANTPITAMIKHYDTLLAFKPNGTFGITYGAITLADNNVTSAFYVTPINREIGNVALGQAKLVQNNPFTLFGRSVYEWRLSSYGAKDERNAKSISDRAIRTLSEIPLASAVCFDNEYNSEYWVCYNGTAVIYNYSADAWYIYDNIPATCFLSADGALYFGTGNGKIMRFSETCRNDNGKEINAVWESGAMDFGRDFKIKYSSEIWIAIKPESGARVTVAVQSNVKSDYNRKIVASSLATFSHCDFNHFSFHTNRQPQVTRVKIKVKKFTFYKLILTSNSASATATILSADIKVRYAGNVK